jgi:hypothetical protein
MFYFDSEWKIKMRGVTAIINGNSGYMRRNSLRSLAPYFVRAMRKG